MLININPPKNFLSNHDILQWALYNLLRLLDRATLIIFDNLLQGLHVSPDLINNYVYIFRTLNTKFICQIVQKNYLEM